jgi:hypothetical protein
MISARLSRIDEQEPEEIETYQDRRKGGARRTDAVKTEIVKAAAPRQFMSVC